ncbi:pyrroloquinoline quinone-dependent dehydrogenase [Reyranella sp. CPCC 100927]|nr:pyrroloquinoline quinone-dependent dehydrogenase [Reyranella sp. CPCC 100927]
MTRRMGRWRMWLWVVAAIVGLVLLGGGAFVYAFQYRPPQGTVSGKPTPWAPVDDDLSWTNTGSDPGHGRYSALAQITSANVAHLAPAWTYRTGELERRGPAARRGKFQATPILAAGHLVFCTPFNRVIALDPITGAERWVYDPQLSDTTIAQIGKAIACRGVAQWTDRQLAADAPCAVRIVTATNDLRLIALDARTGRLCPGFGNGGIVTIVPDKPLMDAEELHITSAPAVIGDVVVVGSASADNRRIDAPSGMVRAFDARSGALLWTFDPVPRRFDLIASPTWEGESAARTGQANVWGPISVDVERDLVFLPTSSPSPDFYGGLRLGANRDANSVVAVRGRTGEVVWRFQTVHHDLWDADVAAAPTLITLTREGQSVPALVFATKKGFVFVLNRETGAPLFAVEELPVPASDVPGERTHPTQPYSTGLPTIVPHTLASDDAFGILFFDRRACRRVLERSRNEGPFTPPSLRGSVQFPMSGGGANWGGVAVDPRSNRMVVNTNRVVQLLTLVPADQVEAARRANPGVEITRQRGAPYGIRREVLLSPLGMPCNPPPWGALTAIDLQSGKLAWEQTLGTTKGLVPLGLSFRWGTPNFGGPIITAGGLVFIGATTDNMLRAFDLQTGTELWTGELPAGGQATPMTYAAGGRQYVVIAAGGHSALGTRIGDTVMAFALPR